MSHTASTAQSKATANQDVLVRTCQMHGIPCQRLNDGSISAESCAIDREGSAIPDILVTDNLSNLKQWLGY